MPAQPANRRFRQRLRELMELQGLSQAELWRRSGVPVRTIARIRKGEQGVTVKMAQRLARGLSVDVEDLLGRSPEGYESDFRSLLGEREAKELHERVATALRLGVYEHVRAAASGIIRAELTRRNRSDPDG